MKTYPTDKIRNVVLLGSTDAGKTLLTEAMLLEGKVIDRKGTIEGKNTVSDYSEIEQLNGKSIYSTVLYTEFMDCKLNLFDTPGSDDFMGAVISTLSVADLAVMVINARHGVEVGTEIFGRWTRKMERPVMFAVNQLDHEKASFENTLESLKQTFGKKVRVVQYPVNAGDGFDTIVDVLLMKMYRYTGESGEREELDIPAEEMERAAALHQELVESAAENDESLMELFFEKGSLEEDEVRVGLGKGMAARDIFPVMCTSGVKTIGAKRLMEFIVKVGASPAQTPPMKDVQGEEVICDASAPTSLFVFKTAVEPHIGEINYFKVMSGTLKEGDDLMNMTTETKERMSQLYVVAGKNRTKVSELVAGDIGAAVKLKNTKSNHTLCASGANIVLPPLSMPNAKFRTAVKATNEAETEKLGELLNRAHQADLSIGVEFSKELRQIILSGQGEHHLNILKWELENLHKMGVEYFPPRIPYRETITKSASGDYRHKKQSGGAGQFGEVHIIIDPYVEGEPAPNKAKVNGKEINLNVRDTQEIDLDWGGKLVFYNCIVGGAIDARFMPAILKGLMEKMEQGPLTGSYARDIRVAVYDGKMHPVDSNEISFKLASRNAFRAAFREAGPKIMEPIYDVEVLVPSDRMGDVMSDLQNRRAIIMGMDSDGGFERIKARVPLAELSRYSTALSSLTSGRATYTMDFAEYAPVPGDIQEKLLKAHEEEENEEA
ncbi:MAG: elongation factor G [Bacteroidetes bacterium]|nr:MAG: elongation factor G [Bacteroidota bacterium]